MTLVVAGPGSAWAQDTAAIKKALSRVAPGETISLRDTSGRSETGRLSGSTDTSITLDGSRNVAANRVTRITVKDSTRNGTVIGALIGGGAGVAGAIALGALCANEGGNCAAANLMLIGLGVGAGAGIGWLGDSLTQHEIYRAGGTARRFSPEVRMRVAGQNRSGALPGFGLSGSVTSESGLGVEVNADRTLDGSDGLGGGVSLDGRALYAFGPSRVQPYVSVGVGFIQHAAMVTYSVPPSPFVPNGATYSNRQTLEAVAPVFGGGIRLQPARHLVIRPEVSWFLETAPNSANRTAVARAGVSIGAAW
jgi:hypothetical protein